MPTERDDDKVVLKRTRCEDGDGECCTETVTTSSSEKKNAVNAMQQWAVLHDDDHDDDDLSCSSDEGSVSKEEEEEEEAMAKAMVKAASLFNRTLSEHVLTSLTSIQRPVQRPAPPKRARLATTEESPPPPPPPSSSSSANATWSFQGRTAVPIVPQPGAAAAAPAASGMGQYQSSPALANNMFMNLLKNNKKQLPTTAPPAATQKRVRLNLQPQSISYTPSSSSRPAAAAAGRDLLSRMSGLSSCTSKDRTAAAAAAGKDLRSRLSSLSAPDIVAVRKKQQQQQASSSNNNTIKPDDHLRALLAAKGKTVRTFSALDLKDFFLEPTEESIHAYTMQVVKAVRQEDIDALRQLHQSGHNLQCSNKFGESIVHAACRRGSKQVLDFLLHQAKVTVKVCCDYGRTPLHDACWSHDLNFGVISQLLDTCPDLLYIEDKRGFTPLAYVRQEHWGAWCRFLDNGGGGHHCLSVLRLMARELKAHEGDMNDGATSKQHECE